MQETKKIAQTNAMMAVQQLVVTERNLSSP
jgi:hypothetical protein